MDQYKLKDEELIELRNIKIAHKIYTLRLEQILSGLYESNKNTFRRSPDSRLKSTASILKRYLLQENRELGFINYISQLSDIAGLRLTITTKDEFKIAKKILSSSKKLKQYGTLDTKMRKKNGKMNDRGYAAYHYFMKFTLDINTRDENLKTIIYKVLEEIKVNKSDLAEFYPVVAEIQIRTLAQDLWAVFEHPERYKGKGEIPQSLNEELYNYAKLMDVADDIAQLTKNRKIYEAQEYFTKKRIIPIHEQSLLNYNRLKTSIDKILVKTESLGSSSTYDLCSLLIQLADQGIFTTKELNEFLTNKLYRDVVNKQFMEHGILRKEMKISLLDNMSFLFCCRQCQIELENVSNTNKDSKKIKESLIKKRDIQIYKKIQEIKDELDFEAILAESDI